MSYSIFGSRREVSNPPEIQSGREAKLTEDLAGPPDSCHSSTLKLLVEDTNSGSIGSSSETTLHSQAPALPTTGNTFHSRTFPSANFAPTILTNEIVDNTQPRTSANTSKPTPIRIPAPTLAARDINRIPTPLSGRGERKGHLFPFSRSPSPRRCVARSLSKSRKSSLSDSEEIFGQLERTWSASPSSHSSGRSPSLIGRLTMHSDSVAPRYPASPLSPKPPSKQSLSPQNSQRRGNHGRQSSRNMQLNLGRYHPSNFPQGDSVQEATSSMPAPQITYTRAPPPVQVESPRLLREKHREFLEKARLSSKLAASPFSAKPNAPRLDPLGSPKGPMTPLELEGVGDYFSVSGAGKVSPAGSPGGTRSPRALSVSSDDDTKPMKSRKVAAA